MSQKRERLRPGLLDLGLNASTAHGHYQLDHCFAVIEKIQGEYNNYQATKCAILNLKGALRYYQHRYLEAIEHFQEVLEEDENNLNALANLELINKELGYWNKVEKYRKQFDKNQKKDHHLKATYLGEQAFAIMFDCYTKSNEYGRFMRAKTLFEDCLKETKLSQIPKLDEVQWKLWYAQCLHRLYNCCLTDSERNNTSDIKVRDACPKDALELLDAIQKDVMEIPGSHDHIKSVTLTYIGLFLYKRPWKTGYEQGQYVTETEAKRLKMDDWLEDPGKCFENAIRVQTNTESLVRYALYLKDKKRQLNDAIEKMESNLKLDGSDGNWFGYTTLGSLYLEKYRTDRKKFHEGNSENPPDISLLDKSIEKCEKACKLNPTGRLFITVGEAYHFRATDSNRYLTKGVVVESEERDNIGIETTVEGCGRVDIHTEIGHDGKVVERGRTEDNRIGDDWTCVDGHTGLGKTVDVGKTGRGQERGTGDRKLVEEEKVGFDEVGTIIGINKRVQLGDDTKDTYVEQMTADSHTEVEHGVEEKTTEKLEEAKSETGLDVVDVEEIELEMKKTDAESPSPGSVSQGDHRDDEALSNRYKVEGMDDKKEMDFKKALENFLRALHHLDGKTVPLHHSSHGKCLFDMGEYRPAVESFKRALELQKEYRMDDYCLLLESLMHLLDRQSGELEQPKARVTRAHGQGKKHEEPKKQDELERLRKEQFNLLAEITHWLKICKTKKMGKQYYKDSKISETLLTKPEALLVLVKYLIEKDEDGLVEICISAEIMKYFPRLLLEVVITLLPRKKFDLIQSCLQNQCESCLQFCCSCSKEVGNEGELMSVEEVTSDDLLKKWFRKRRQGMSASDEEVKRCVQKIKDDKNLTIDEKREFCQKMSDALADLDRKDDEIRSSDQLFWMFGVHWLSKKEDASLEDVQTAKQLVKTLHQQQKKLKKHFGDKTGKKKEGTSNDLDEVDGPGEGGLDQKEIHSMLAEIEESAEKIPQKETFKRAVSMCMGSERDPEALDLTLSCLNTCASSIGLYQSAVRKEDGTKQRDDFQISKPPDSPKVRYEEYDYDFYVLHSYDRSDKDWVVYELLPTLEGKYGFKGCLEIRDFKVGGQRVNEFVEKVKKSYKVLILLTESFHHDYWCQYQLNTAVLGKISTNNIIPLQKNGCDENVPPAIQQLVSLEAVNSFDWERLVKALLTD